MANGIKKEQGKSPITKESALQSVEQGDYNDCPKWGNLIVDIFTTQEEEISANETDYKKLRRVS